MVFGPPQWMEEQFGADPEVILVHICGKQKMQSNDFTMRIL